MGGDGGSIPTRRCLVKYKKKQNKKDAREENISRYGFCQLTANRLKRPIVISRLGKLYNKDAVLNFLVEYAQSEKTEEISQKIDGLVKMKEFYECELTDNADYSDLNVPGTSFLNDFPFICPVAALAFNGAQPFVYGTTSKQLVSEKALREANIDILPKKFDKDEIRPLYTDELEDLLEDPVTSMPFGHPITRFL